MNDTPVAQQLANKILAVVAEKMAVKPHTLLPSTDLFVAGLDSITLMALVAHWRAAGHSVDFAKLAREPRVEAWLSYFSHSKPGSGEPKIAAGASIKQSHPIKTNQPQHQHKPFPLAPMQYAYWLGRDPGQPLGGVSAHLYTEFDSNKAQSLNPSGLSQALEQLVKRHGSLRLQVTPDGEQRHLTDKHNVELQLNDWRDRSEGEAQQLLSLCRHSFSSQTLDVDAGEVLAIALSLMPDGTSRLHLDVDMIAADAVSYRTLIRELAQLYQNPKTALPGLPMSYRDCRLLSEQGWSAVQESSGKWWQERLENLPDGPQLPLKYALDEKTDSPPLTTRRFFHFSPELRDKLYAQCRERGLTPATVLATVMAETLAGWSTNSRFLLNVPLFLRPMDGPDISNVVGDFSSSVLLDIDTSQAQTFLQRAKQIQSRLHEDATHAEYGGVHVLRDLGKFRGTQVTAPVVFTSALNLGELFDTAVRETFGDPVWIISQGPQVLLDSQITELDGGLLLNWDCREDAFMDDVLEPMFDFFRESVLALANNPAIWEHSMAEALPTERVRANPPTAKPKSSDQPSAPPQTPIEHTVAAVWGEVIGGANDNIHQNLFAAGGDSILATTLVAQLREIFGVQAIDMHRLFNAPTIKGLADAIGATGEPQQMENIAGIYCEILELDDESLIAEMEQANDLEEAVIS